MKHYIEIPYETFYRLQFPDLCPFTLRPGPEAIWEVHGKTRSREAFSIPGVVMVTKNRKYRFPLPAAAKFVRTQKKLRMASGLLIALFLLSVPFQIFLKVPGEIVGAAFLLWPVILMLIFLERWRQRNVRIDYVGNRFVEIVIRKTKYADEFCRINGLQSKRKLINFRWE